MPGAYVFMAREYASLLAPALATPEGVTASRRRMRRVLFTLVTIDVPLVDRGRRFVRSRPRDHCAAGGRARAGTHLRRRRRARAALAARGDRGVAQAARATPQRKRRPPSRRSHAARSMRRRSSPACSRWRAIRVERCSASLSTSPRSSKALRARRAGGARPRIDGEFAGQRDRRRRRTPVARAGGESPRKRFSSRTP